MLGFFARVFSCVSKKKVHPEPKVQSKQEGQNKQKQKENKCPAMNKSSVSSSKSVLRSSLIKQTHNQVNSKVSVKTPSKKIAVKTSQNPQNSPSVLQASDISSSASSELRTPVTTFSDFVMNDVNAMIIDPTLDDHFREPQIWDLYTKIRQLGEGTFGRVYEAKKISTRQTCSIKVFKCSSRQEQQWEVMKMIKNEIGVLQALKNSRSKHCIQLLDFKMDIVRNQYYLVLEYFPMNLKTYLSKNPNLPPHEKKRIVQQIISGVGELHALGYMHRDLKPENILIDDLQVVKIADFGISEYQVAGEAGYDPMVGTLWCQAPEILLGIKNYSKAIDLWSLGVMIAKILTGNLLANERNARSQLDKIFKMIGTPELSSEFEEFFKDSPLKSLIPQHKDCGKLKTYLLGLSFQETELIQGLLRINPAERLRCQELLATSQYCMNKFDDDSDDQHEKEVGEQEEDITSKIN